MIKFQLKLIVRPTFPEVKEIMLEAVIEDDFISMESLAALAFRIEYTLNEHLPQIRVHSRILEVDKND